MTEMLHKNSDKVARREKVSEGIQREFPVTNHRFKLGGGTGQNVIRVARSM